MPSVLFVAHPVSEIFYKTKRGQLYAPQAWVNPRPTGGGLSRDPPLFLNICQTNEYTNIKLSAPFGTSISYPMCKYKFRSYHRLVSNDVRVTSYSDDFDAK